MKRNILKMKTGQFKWFLSFFIAFLFHFNSNAFGQNLIVSGKVTESGTVNGLPGVNVVITGTSVGTITDNEGNYSIKLSDSNASLKFSFIGFLPETIDVNNQTIINVSLIPDIQSLQELVVVGYGTMKKSDITGAISSVKSEDLSPVANTNVAQMLQGKASGVQIIQQSAQPGGALKVLVRGAASTNANNEPLYIIDGFPISTNNMEGGYEIGRNYSTGVRSPLNSINPNDIESIEVLKDASSTAIYGARAANGVVIITTKRGSNGVKINYDGRFSTQKTIRYMDVLNASEFMTMYNQHRYDYDAILGNIYPYGTGDAKVFADKYKYKYSEEDIKNAGEGTDWFSEVTQPGMIQDHNFSLRAGDKKTQIFTSFNYFNQQGVIINSGLKRYSGRVNLDQKVNEKIKLGVNITGSNIFNNNAALGAGQWERVGVISSAYGFPSIYPVYDEKGNYSINELYSNNPNPVSFKHLVDNTLEERLLANAFVDIQLAKGLFFKPTIGYDRMSSERNSYTPDKTVFREGGNGRGSRSKNGSMSTLFESVLRYNIEIKQDHSFGALAGYSYQVFSGDGLYGFSEDYFTNVFNENSLETGEINKEVRSYRYKNKLASYFSRVNYSYRGKYIAQFTGRVDGSDKFGANNKYGFFPSASLAWNVSKESFLLGQNTLTDLKFRVGYGQTGNDNIEGNAYAYYGTDGYRYQFNDQVKTGLGKTSIANPDLKWETTTESNIGIDYGLWNNRLFGSVEFFVREVSDLLFKQPLQSFQEVDFIYMNIGKTKSMGWEFNARAKIFVQDFKWDSYINLSQYNDRWDERSKAAIENLSSYQSVKEDLRPVYSYLASHIFQIGEEQPYTNVSYVPGNLVVKDVGSFAKDENGNNKLDKNNRRIIEKTPDGIINDADRAYLGKRDPKLILGWGNNLSYKNFDLNFFIYGMLDYWTTNNNYDFYTSRSEFLYGGFNRSKDFMDVWTTSNPNGTIPATPQSKVPIGYEALSYQSTSFVRLKNLTLTYNIPVKIYGTGVKAYIDVANLFTLTNLKGMDPESVTFSGESQYNKNDGENSGGLGAYPNVKTYTLGISIDF